MCTLSQDWGCILLCASHADEFVVWGLAVGLSWSRARRGRLFHDASGLGPFTRYSRLISSLLQMPFPEENPTTFLPRPFYWRTSLDLAVVITKRCCIRFYVTVIS
ncbi:hypothetical protein FOYG_04540 [Fusarium oxysporum NRRL 32931]|uniref:Uncharacterized protein n=1 Tax=Fusarium oxysporum NRRL 32931 TaxID=660029 RepID=W9IKQ5_FUSOX|nr:hypothetical protein FOYG_04540 [Fusarium oxysporum NRRL 32931]